MRNARIQMTTGLVLILLGLSTTAQAQTRPGVIRGIGGITFMSETAGIVGLGVGARVHPNVEIFAEGGRLTNVLPHHLQRDLDDAARSFGNYYGAPLRIDGRAPAVYALGMVRVTHLAGTRLRLFLDVGGGVAHGESDIRARAGTRDVSAEVTRAIGVKASENAGVAAVGGGLMVEVTDRVGLELGYRFMRIFTDDPRINTANLSAGIRWGF